MKCLPPSGETSLSRKPTEARNGTDHSSGAYVAQRGLLDEILPLSRSPHTSYINPCFSTQTP